MNQFPVSSGEASNFQQNYQEMVRLMTQLLDQRMAKFFASKPQHGMKIYEKGHLIYGRGEDGILRDELSGLVGQILDPERVNRLRKLRETPVGQFFPEAPNVIMILDGETVLKSDKNGRVLTNWLNPILEGVNDYELSPSEAAVTPSESLRGGDLNRANSPELTDGERLESVATSYNKSYKNENFLEAVESRPPEEENFGSSLDLESAAPPPFSQNSIVNPEGLEKAVAEELLQNEELTTVSEQVEPLENSTEEMGLAQIHQQINQLPDDAASLKQLLLLQSRQISELSKQLQQLNQKQPSEDFQPWIKERIQSPQDIRWWQRGHQLWSKMRERWQSHSRSQQSARSLHELFHRYSDGETYRSRQYQISKQDNFYRLTDSQDQLLVQWQETPLGIQVNQSQLSQPVHQSIEKMRSQLLEGKTPDGDFAPDGSSDARYFARVDRVVQTLVRYAQAHGGKAEVKGRFHYRWSASAQGQVRIDRANGGGTLLVKSQGHLQSRLNEADLRYFEQMLPALTKKSASIRKSQADLER